MAGKNKEQYVRELLDGGRKVTVSLTPQMAGKLSVLGKRKNLEEALVHAAALGCLSWEKSVAIKSPRKKSAKK